MKHYLSEQLTIPEAAISYDDSSRSSYMKIPLIFEIWLAETGGTSGARDVAGMNSDGIVAPPATSISAQQEPSLLSLGGIWLL